MPVIRSGFGHISPFLSVGDGNMINRFRVKIIQLATGAAVTTLAFVVVPVSILMLVGTADHFFGVSPVVSTIVFSVLIIALALVGLGTASHEWWSIIRWLFALFGRLGEMIGPLGYEDTRPVAPRSQSKVLTVVLPGAQRFRSVRGGRSSFTPDSNERRNSGATEPGPESSFGSHEDREHSMPLSSVLYSQSDSTMRSDEPLREVLFPSSRTSPAENPEGRLQ